MLMLRDREKGFEGLRIKLYYDENGDLTGGWGHNFTSKGIPPRIMNKYPNVDWVFKSLHLSVCEELLDADIEDAFFDLTKIFDLKSFGCKNQFCLYNEIDIDKALLPKQVVYVLVDMMFNMGKVRFMGFEKMIAAVDKKDWHEMAMEIVDSDYWRNGEKKKKRLEDCKIIGAYNRAQKNVDLVMELIDIKYTMHAKYM